MIAGDQTLLLVQVENVMREANPLVEDGSVWNQNAAISSSLTENQGLPPEVYNNTLYFMLVAHCGEREGEHCRFWATRSQQSHERSFSSDRTRIIEFSMCPAHIASSSATLDVNTLARRVFLVLLIRKGLLDYVTWRRPARALQLPSKKDLSEPHRTA